MPQVLIGGVERDISQVESYCEYYGGKGKSVSELLENSRADRLVKKVLYKKISEKATKIAKGDIEFVEIPMIKLEKDLDSYEDSIKKAKDIELMYANQAREIADL